MMCDSYPDVPGVTALYACAMTGGYFRTGTNYIY